VSSNVGQISPYTSESEGERAARIAELVGGGPASADGSLAATTDPRSDGLPAAW